MFLAKAPGNGGFFVGSGDGRRGRKGTKETKDAKETKDTKETKETKEPTCQRANELESQRARELTSQRAKEFAELAAAFVFKATDLPANLPKRVCRKAP